MKGPSIVTKYVSWVFLFSVTVKMVFFLFAYNHPERFFDADSELYVQLGEGLLTSFAFPSIFRAPVYPSFIALVYAVFGHFPQAVVASQIFLDSLTAVFVVLIFFEISGQNPYAYAAGFFYAVSPFSVVYSHMVLSETLFTFILIASVYFFVLFINNNKRRYLVASSVLFGSGVLCRPIALYLPLFLAGFIFMNGFRLRHRLINCLIFLFAFYIILIPWYIKNFQQYEYLGISSVKDINIFVYEAPAVLMIKDNPLSIIKVSINETLYKYQMYLWEKVKKKYNWEINNPFEVSEDALKLSILQKEGAFIIKENIPIVLLSHTAGIGRTLCPYAPHFEKLVGYNIKILKLFAFLIDAFIMVLSLFGIKSALSEFSDIRASRIITVTMFFLILYLTFIPGIVGYPRFKIPVMPYISIFAAFGLEKIRKDI
jgi:hypothetical protein